MKIERRPTLRTTTLLDYILMYVLAAAVGAIAGVFLAPQVAGEIYLDNNATSLESAQNMAMESVWACIIFCSALPCLYLTCDLVYTYFADRRELREKIKQKKKRARNRKEWEKQWGPKESEDEQIQMKRNLADRSQPETPRTKQS